jgi:putative membrane protein
MHYSKVKPDEMIVRDYLAAERTHLANERTLLSYLRAAILLLVTAITMLKFFENDSALVIIAIVLLPLSLLIALLGIGRFFQVRKKLAVFNRQSQSEIE